METLDKLSQSDLNANGIELSEAARKKLIILLPDLQIKDSVIMHNIQSPNGRAFFKSYDCLSSVWLSKEISEKIMSSAAKKYNFNYVHYDHGNESNT